MKLAMLIVADYASVDQATGKLNILGAFSRIAAKQFPARHPRMALAVKLTAELGDHSNTRTVAVELIDADGKGLMRYSAPFQLPHGGIQREYNLVLELNQLEFPHPGVYEFKVYVDDECLGSVPIELVPFVQQSE